MQSKNSRYRDIYMYTTKVEIMYLWESSQINI